MNNHVNCVCCEITEDSDADLNVSSQGLGLLRVLWRRYRIIQCLITVQRLYEH
jgi:hypothetical protein